MTASKYNKHNKCDLCGKTYKRMYTLNCHVKRVHASEKPTRIFVCSICNHEFSQRANLGKHFNEIHEQNKEFTCDLCEKQFKRKDHLTGHKNAIHGTSDKGFICDLCQKTFIST